MRAVVFKAVARLITLSVVLVSSVVYADESVVVEPPPTTAEELPSIFDYHLEKPAQRSVAFDEFIEESTVSLNLRNFYFNRGKPDALDSIAWAQGGSIKYETGKIADVF